MKLSLVIVSSLLLTLHNLVQSKTYIGDIQVLMDIKNGFDPVSIFPGSCLSSWDFSVDPCDRVFSDRFTCGIRCDVIFSDYRVTEIMLDQAGYSGSWNLPYLDVLDLSSNSLSGSIPVSISNLTQLRRLSLSKNLLTGSIPGSIGFLRLLQELCLDNNRFTGSIPPSFNGLVRLNRLELQTNNLTGELPDLSQLENLKFIYLSDNSFSGEFPPPKAAAPAIFPGSVVEISIRNNNLTGSLTGAAVSDLKLLEVLDLSHNRLTGVLPAAIFRHKSMQQLAISHKKLTSLQAPKSNELRRINSKLIAIYLSHNELRGSLPEFMAALPMLSALSLEHNEFSGTIPIQYALKTVMKKGNTASFQRLLLGSNYLFGPVPRALLGLKYGPVNVSLVDNCLFSCPYNYFVCQGGFQKSPIDCEKFIP